MTDVAELEKRISAALDRIGTGLEAFGGADDPGEVATLQESLQAEKTASAQLQERVNAIKEKQEKLVGGLETDVANLRDELAKHDGDLAALKQANDLLRANNLALRDANKQGLGDVDLINKGMVAELDALRLSRDTDRNELDAILLNLKPLIEGGANA